MECVVSQIEERYRSARRCKRGYEGLLGVYNSVEPAAEVDKIIFVVIQKYVNMGAV